MDDNLYDEFGNYIGPDLNEMGKFSDESENEEEMEERQKQEKENDNIIPITVHI